MGVLYSIRRPRKDGCPVRSGGFSGGDMTRSFFKLALLILAGISSAAIGRGETPDVMREQAHQQPCSHAGPNCPAGWICSTEIIPCQTDPHASTCARNVCVPKPVRVYAVLETGPDDSLALRIQFGANAQGQEVWTVLYGSAWQSALRGQLKVSTRVRVCTGWGIARHASCSFRDGRVEFSAPVPNRAGLLVQGVVWYRESTATPEIALPFSTTIRDGRRP